MTRYMIEVIQSGREQFYAEVFDERTGATVYQTRPYATAAAAEFDAQLWDETTPTPRPSEPEYRILIALPVA